VQEALGTAWSRVREQALEVALRVQQADRLRGEAELVSSQDLEQLLERAEPAGSATTASESSASALRSCIVAVRLQLAQAGVRDLEPARAPRGSRRSRARAASAASASTPIRPTRPPP